LLRRLPVRLATAGRLIDRLRSAAVAVAVAVVVRAAVAGTLGMVAVVVAVVVRAAVVAAGRDMRDRTLAAAIPVRRQHRAVTANPTAIAHLINLATRSMRRVTRITQPIAATVELARARNISARSKAVGMVVPANQRDAFPPVAELASSIVLVADGQADVDNTFA
jgi:hypothetical protein